MAGRPYSAGLSGVGSVRCDGSEGVKSVLGGVASVDVSLSACEKEGNKIQ